MAVQCMVIDVIYHLLALGIANEKPSLDMSSLFNSDWNLVSFIPCDKAF